MSTALSLPFSVACSSFLPPHAPAELANKTPDALGWLSAKNCPYPQHVELTLAQPMQPCDVFQLAVVSHESSIAKRIDVSVCGLSGEWRNLGYLEFDDNRESGFMARELQTVHLGAANVTRVRLSLSSPHTNARNTDQQVGLIALDLTGRPSAALVLPAAPIVTPRVSQSSLNAGIHNVNGEGKHSVVPMAGGGNFLAPLETKLDELRDAREQAVEQERYDEAKSLKQLETDIRHVLNSAAELERRKVQAVEREDYDAAKEAKAELARLLASAPLQSVGRPTSTSTQRGSAVPPLAAVSSPPSSQSHTVSPVSQRDDRPIRPSPPVRGMQSAAGGASSLPSEASEPAPPNFWGPEIDPDNSLPIAEALSASTLDESRALVHVFGEYLVRCVYSANIKLRVAALMKLQASVRDGLGSDKDVDAVLAICAMGLREHAAPHVFVNADRLFALVIARTPLERLPLNASANAHALCSAAVDALGASSAQVADTAHNLVTLTLPKVFGPAHAVRALLRPTTTRGKKSTLWRPTHAKILALHVFAESFPDQCPVDVVVDWLAKLEAFDHANASVRDGARQLLGLLARSHSPGAVEASLRDRLSPLLLDKVLASVEELSAKVQCVYCHKAGFADEGALDLHYWGECPMLSACPRCAQVIEVSRLNDHLLLECAQRAHHKSCPRCKEAIALMFFEQHVRRNACLEAKPVNVASRCPLCHLDILPGEEGWIAHLVHDGCVKNPRGGGGLL